MFKRLQARLDRIEGEFGSTADKAKETMSEADKTMLAVREEVLGTLKDLILDIQDGVGISLEHTGEGSLLDFALGNTKKLPIKITVNISEDDESASP